jgi:hypothetical protein
MVKLQANIFYIQGFLMAFKLSTIYLALLLPQKGARVGLVCHGDKLVFYQEPPFNKSLKDGLVRNLKGTGLDYSLSGSADG